MNEQTPEIVRQEIAEIESHIPQEHESTSTEIFDRAAVHKAVAEKIYQNQIPQTNTAPQHPTSSHQPSYLLPEYKDQVQNFVTVAFNQSITQAIEQVRATHNAGLIDAFHDALVDELYPILLERAKLHSL